MEWVLSWASILSCLIRMSTASSILSDLQPLSIRQPKQLPLMAHPSEASIEHGFLADELAEDAWWSGVDIVDTALRPEDHLEARLLENEDMCHMFDNICDDPGRISALVAPPKFLPPPPPPAFLTEWLESFPADSNRCFLCEWAALNDTSNLLSSTDATSEHTWIPVLVIVALVSAMLGAILMVVALKCRSSRFKVIPRGGSIPTMPAGFVVGDKDHPVTEMPDSPTPVNTLFSSTETRLEATRDALARNPAAITGWRIKLWRKVASQNVSSSASSCKPADGTYDSMSVVYAELQSVAETSDKPDSIYEANMYSEIAEPQLPQYKSNDTPSPSALTLRKLLSNGTYENAAYVISECVVLDVNDSSSGCASTPSSAYYSDLSNSDRSANGKSQQPHWPMNWPSQSHPQQHLTKQKKMLHRHPTETTEPLDLAALPLHNDITSAQRVNEPDPSNEGHVVHPHVTQPGREALNPSNPPLGHSELMPGAYERLENSLHSRTLPHSSSHPMHTSLLRQQDPGNHFSRLHSRDLMRATLHFIPDNFQMPDAHAMTDLGSLSLQHDHKHSGMNHASGAHALPKPASFSRRGQSASLNTSQRPLPPLPSRQVQGPKRRYPYQPPALGTDHGDQVANPLTSVPSEYV